MEGREKDRRECCGMCSVEERICRREGKGRAVHVFDSLICMALGWTGASPHCKTLTRGHNERL